MQLDHHPVEVIDSKTELQGFKRNDVCKVVGYFESTNAAGTSRNAFQERNKMLRNVTKCFVSQNALGTSQNASGLPFSFYQPVSTSINLKFFLLCCGNLS